MHEKTTAEDRERVKLLHTVSGSKNAFKKLPMEKLLRLRDLIQKKDYSHNKKAHKSKMKLLAKINVRIYELQDEEKFNH